MISAMNDSEYLEEDYISNWSCCICDIRLDFDTCTFIHQQFLDTGRRVFIDRQYVIYIKCSDCGSLYHATCVSDSVKPQNILDSIFFYRCPACTLA